MLNKNLSMKVVIVSFFVIFSLFLSSTGFAKEVCVDTDNGEEYFVSGSCTNDEVFGGKTIDDACQSGNDVIIEQMCKDVEDVGYKCWGVSYECPNGCENGECKPVCIDTDGGEDYFTKGTVTSYNSYGVVGPTNDYCDGETVLRELSCNGLSVSNDFYNCPNGCDDGVCLDTSIETTSEETDTSIEEIAIYCTDSDGRDYYENGNVRGIDSNGEQYSLHDNCFDYDPSDDLHEGVRVREYICDGDYSTSSVKTCKYGCLGGKCLEEEYDDDCFKSDEYLGYPARLGVKGTCVDSTGTYDDSSPDGTSVADYSCGPVNTDGKPRHCIGQGSYNCLSHTDTFGWTKSVDGACIGDEIVCVDNEKRCTGDDLQICFNNKWKTMQVCDGSCDKISLKCMGGEVSSCTDSDGGTMYEIKGVTYGYDSELEDYTTNIDICLESTVTEYFCIGKNINEIAYECEYGCKNGECVSADDILVQETRETKQDVNNWLNWAEERFTPLIESFVGFFENFFDLGDESQ
jgi:hypothetical protein